MFRLKHELISLRELFKDKDGDAPGTRLENLKKYYPRCASLESCKIRSSDGRRGILDWDSYYRWSIKTEYSAGSPNSTTDDSDSDDACDDLPGVCTCCGQIFHQECFSENLQTEDPKKYQKIRKDQILKVELEQSLKLNNNEYHRISLEVPSTKNSGHDDAEVPTTEKHIKRRNATFFNLERKQFARDYGLHVEQKWTREDLRRSKVTDPFGVYHEELLDTEDEPC